MALTFESLYGHVSVQSQAYSGRRSFGVPPGGPFDPCSSQLANALLNNALFDACLECAGAAFVAKVTQGCWISWTGFGHQLLLNGVQVTPNSRFWAEAGSELALTPRPHGLRCYLALPGGVDLALNPRKALLSAQDSIKSRESPTFSCPQRASRAFVELDNPVLRIVQSPDLHHKTANVTTSLDRVGIRMDCHGLDAMPRNDRSRPSVIGAIQGAPNGQLLIHGPDGPTIGGYRVLGVVASVDHWLLGQLRPGVKVQLRNLSLSEARLAWLEQVREFKDLLRSINGPGQ